MLLVIDGNNIMEEHWVWEKLEDEFDVRYIKGRDYTQEELKEIMKDYKYIFNGSSYLSSALLNDLEKLEYIGILATGYNIVDLKAAKENNITVSNVPNYSTEIVAQHTIALLLAICSNMRFYAGQVEKGLWPKETYYYDKTKPIIELKGKSLGILGYGEIGRRVGEIAKALGMKIFYYDRNESGAENQLALDVIFQISDVISLHLPLSDETKGIINSSTISKMKDGAIILNTARGKLINEEDLAEALKSGKIYACALDVVAQEPIKKDNPLLKLENALITPHMAWASRDARGRLLEIAYENFQAYLRGEDKNVLTL